MLEESDNLKNRLSDWLESQGYPLEIEVASSFRPSGFHVIQAEYYTDPESGTTREVDLIAHRQRTVHGSLLRVSFAIECKSSKDKPRVLFTSQQLRLAARARVVQRSASSLGSRYLYALSNFVDVQQLPTFELGERPAYGLTQAFTSASDVAYAAANVAAKATVSLTHRANKYERAQFPIYEIVFPVVVVDGRIFEYYLADSNQKVLSEVAQGVLIWRNQIVNSPHTIIHVVTVSALSNFLHDADLTTDALLTSYDGEIARINMT